jgi:hypothetical protein
MVTAGIDPCITCVFSIFHVVVDNLKQFEPAHDAVSLNSFAVSYTVNTFTGCKYKKLWI